MASLERIHRTLNVILMVMWLHFVVLKRDLTYSLETDTMRHHHVRHVASGVVSFQQLSSADPSAVARVGALRCAHGHVYWTGLVLLVGPTKLVRYLSALYCKCCSLISRPHNEIVGLIMK